jgi:hypothetical protein
MATLRGIVNSELPVLSSQNAFPNHAPGPPLPDPLEHATINHSLHSTRLLDTPHASYRTTICVLVSTHESMGPASRFQHPSALSMPETGSEMEIESELRYSCSHCTVWRRKNSKSDVEWANVVGTDETSTSGSLARPFSHSSADRNLLDDSPTCSLLLLPTMIRSAPTFPATFWDLIHFLYAGGHASSSLRSSSYS